jgi:hypothetical protein
MCVARLLGHERVEAHGVRTVRAYRRWRGLLMSVSESVEFIFFVQRWSGGRLDLL